MLGQEQAPALIYSHIVNEGDAMRKILIIIFALCILPCLMAGCDNNDSQNNDTTTVTTTELPSKKELSQSEFQEAISSAQGYDLSSEYTDNEEKLKEFPYDGLSSCTVVTDGENTVANFLVFTDEESANKVIDEAKEENSMDYNDEVGKNYEALTQETYSITRVGSTVLTIATNDQDISNFLLSLIEY
jgi:hypothetical protein